jgi:hypothetical protein
MLERSSSSRYFSLVCGDDGFYTKVQEYTKNLGNAPLFTGLIVSLLGMAAAHGFPLDPAISTVVVLYILGCSDPRLLEEVGDLCVYKSFYFYQ